MQNHISLPFYRSPTIASLQLIIKKNGSQPMHCRSGVAGHWIMLWSVKAVGILDEPGSTPPLAFLGGDKASGLLCDLISRELSDSNAKCKVTPALVAFKGLLPTFNTSGCIPRRRQGIASAAVGAGIYKQQEDSLGS